MCAFFSNYPSFGHCKGGRSNSCRSAIIKFIIYGGDGGGGGGGGGGGFAGGGCGGGDGGWCGVVGACGGGSSWQEKKNYKNAIIILT